MPRTGHKVKGVDQEATKFLSMDVKCTEPLQLRKALEDCFKFALCGYAAGIYTSFELNEIVTFTMTFLRVVCSKVQYQFAIRGSCRSR